MCRILLIATLSFFPIDMGTAGPTAQQSDIPTTAPAALETRDLEVFRAVMVLRDKSEENFQKQAQSEPVVALVDETTATTKNGIFFHIPEDELTSEPLKAVLISRNRRPFSFPTPVTLRGALFIGTHHLEAYLKDHEVRVRYGEPLTFWLPAYSPSGDTALVYAYWWDGFMGGSGDLYTVNLPPTGWKNGHTQTHWLK